MEISRQFFQHYVDLVLAMTGKELKARYKHTFFGFIWIIINPVLQTAVIGFIFKNFAVNKIENYYIFLLTGLHAWNFFSLSLAKAVPSIVYERSLIKKTFFPRSTIPVSIILANFVHFSLGLVVLLVLVLFAEIVPTYFFWSLFYGAVALFFFTTGLSLMTSALNVRFRDVNFIVQAVVTVWFYATPILYDLRNLPDTLKNVIFLNPITVPVLALRQGLLGGEMIPLTLLLLNVLLVAVTFFVGLFIFEKKSKDFDDWI